MTRIRKSKRTLLACFILLLGMQAKTQSVDNSDSIVKAFKLDSTVKVEIESEFPGGAAGWSRFLGSTLVYPKKAVRKKIQGQVIAKFIVEKDGSLSNIEIVSGPEELWPAVLDVLKQSPNWKPAVQNGKKVRSFKMQPINFRLEP